MTSVNIYLMSLTSVRTLILSAVVLLEANKWINQGVIDKLLLYECAASFISNGGPRWWVRHLLCKVTACFDQLILIICSVKRDLAAFSIGWQM